MDILISSSGGLELWHAFSAHSERNAALCPFRNVQFHETVDRFDFDRISQCRLRNGDCLFYMNIVSVPLQDFMRPDPDGYEQIARRSAF